jgi:hypothetical protein
LYLALGTLILLLLVFLPERPAGLWSVLIFLASLVGTIAVLVAVSEKSEFPPPIEPGFEEARLDIGARWSLHFGLTMEAMSILIGGAVTVGNGSEAMARNDQIVNGCSGVAFWIAAFVITTTYPKTQSQVGVRLYEGSVALAGITLLVGMLTAYIGLWEYVPWYWLMFILICSMTSISIVILARFSDYFNLVERQSSVRTERYVGPRWTFRLGRVLTAVSLSLGMIVVLLNAFFMPSSAVIVSLSLCAVLSFSVQQYVLSSAEGPLPGQVPVNVAAVLTFCVIVAKLVTTATATVNNTVETYWLLYITLVMAVASGAMMAARFYAAAGATPAAPSRPALADSADAGAPVPQVEADLQVAAEPEPDPHMSSEVKLSFCGICGAATTLEKGVAIRVAAGGLSRQPYVLIPGRGGYDLLAAEQTAEGDYRPRSGDAVLIQSPDR